MTPSQALSKPCKPRLFLFEGQWHAIAPDLPRSTRGSTPTLAYMRLIFFRHAHENRLTTATEPLE